MTFAVIYCSLKLMFNNTDNLITLLNVNFIKSQTEYPDFIL